MPQSCFEEALFSSSHNRTEDRVRKRALWRGMRRWEHQSGTPGWQGLPPEMVTSIWISNHVTAVPASGALKKIVFECRRGYGNKGGGMTRASLFGIVRPFCAEVFGRGMFQTTIAIVWS